MKTCFKCHQIKPLDDFYRHSQMSDGRVNKCKECNKTDVKKNRASKVDYYKAYDAKRFQDDPRVKERHLIYMQTDAGKVSHRQSILKGRAKSPEKYHARNIVNNAVRDGILIKPSSCEMCKNDFISRLIHGHHEDYNKPLEVMWLCPACHTQRHKERDKEIKYVI